MKLDLRRFVQATNPANTLFVENPEQDKKYYIDFSSVRGGQIIDELRDNITLWSADAPTCQLFTGHIGCGKSTELLRLKAELEQEGFHVVYFVSDQDLEMSDVDVSDILLAIARRVSESIEKLKVDEPRNPKDIIKKVGKLLQTEIELSAESTIPGVGKVGVNIDEDFKFEVGIPGIGEVTVDSKEGVSLVAPLIGKIAAKAKASPEFRSKLRERLEPRTAGILEAINSELLVPAQEELKQHGKKGLVVIVDNLDKIDNSAKTWGRSQSEYLFVDRGEQLRKLKCHLIYTMPVALRFSNDIETLKQRFIQGPKVLPMVPVRFRDGSECSEGMALLREMVLARAFPDLAPEQRLQQITEIFDGSETFNRLCQVSGGHVRNLLRLLNESIKKERGLPVSRKSLEETIRAYRNDLVLVIDSDEWELLRQVMRDKKVAGDDRYKTLIRSMFVYEYYYSQDNWFDLNPILADAEELKNE
ncbi:MAG: ATP-binding protein [Symploca sp. SIO2C1]|nr:ATP-binding protein [Symploca sp. SIO2C1]